MTYMPDEPEYSVVEEIDPEPQDGGAWFNHVREAMLGGLLLLGLLLWALWQWADGEARGNSYNAGVQAAINQDWDRAKAQFSSASGYKDADKRAESAAQMVRERDLHYNSALDHKAREEWIPAMSDLAEVQKVQLNYSDTAHLQEQARQNVYKDALSGVVVLRSGAQPPGLYFRSGNMWSWLEGSDLQSAVLGSGVSGQVVYDAPFVVPAGQPQTETDGRQVILATLPDGNTTSKATYIDLAFKTHDYQGFNWQESGVWAYTFRHMSQTGRGPIGQGRDDLEGLAFQPKGSNTITLVMLPNLSQNRIVLDIDYVRARLLLAEWSDSDTTGPIVKVYMEDVNGANRRLLYTHYGKLARAQFSPDGSYMLLTTVTYATAGDMVEDIGTVAVLMVNLVDTSDIHLLTQRSGINHAGVNGTPAPISSDILSEGLYAGQILLSWQGEEYVSLLVIDPRDLSVKPLEVRVSTHGHRDRLEWAGSQTNTGLLLTLQSFQPDIKDVSPGQQVSPTITLVNLRPGDEPVVGTVSLNGPLQQSAAELHGDSLLYMVFRAAARGDGITEISRIPLSAMQPVSGERNIERQLKSDVIYVSTEANGSFYPNFNLGSRAFAYTDSYGDLYAHVYEGVNTVKLDKGIGFLYNNLDTNYSQNGLVWLR